MSYAKDTEVSVARSQAEIESVLMNYGATAFAYGREGLRVMIAFKFDGRHYRIFLALPDPQDFPNRRAGNGRIVSGYKELQQEERRRWRSLALWIKAVVVAVEDGIVTIEQALQAFTLLPDGRTAGDWMAPQLERVYATGQMPPLLPGLPAPQDEQD